MSITVKGGVNAKGSYVPLPPPTLPWVAVAKTPGYETSRRWDNTWFPNAGVFVESGGAVLANSPQGMLMYSADGASYSLANAPDVPGSSYRDYASQPQVFGNEVFLYVGDENNVLPTYLYRSTDGVNWTSQALNSPTGSTAPVYPFVYNNGAELLTDMYYGETGRFARSTNGVDWVMLGLSYDPVLEYLNNLFYDSVNSRWCMILVKYVDDVDWEVENTVMKFSYDGGVTFGDRTIINLPPEYVLYQVVYGPNNEYIGNGDLYNGSTDGTDVFYKSTDLINWTITYDVPRLPGKWLTELMYIPGVGYLSTGAASYATSSNGTNWKRIHTAHGYYRCYSIAQSPTVVAAPQSSATAGGVPAHFYFNKSGVTFDNLPPLVPLPTDTDTTPPAFDLSDLPPHLRNPNGPWARRMQQLSKK